MHRLGPVRPGTWKAARFFAVSLGLSGFACQKHDDHGVPAPSASAQERTVPSKAPFSPEKVERKDKAMGTSVAFVAFTTPQVSKTAALAAIESALQEMRRLEGVLSEWRDASDVGQINEHAGHWVSVGPETLTVIEKSLWAGHISQGTFDITFQSMGDLWKFGSAQEPTPRVPTRAEVESKRRLIDYRQVEVDSTGRRARIPKGRKIGLGGIAKGYIVDRSVEVLRRAGLKAFLVQAGGDLYGAGRKPDGSAWISGIQDPRGPAGSFFATIELQDRAFSTAGDYARFYMVDGKRYHHIIDPRTGYPATRSRSVTVWAPDALTADVVDDSVFILGAEKGLRLAESLPGVGVVVVDAQNKVWISERLRTKVEVLKDPTDGV